MSIFEMFKSAVGQVTEAPKGMTAVEQCCSRLGWGIDKRFNDTNIGLDFTTAAGPRQVIIHAERESHYVVLSVFSNFSATAQNFNPTIPAYLLERNGKLIVGAWRVFKADDTLRFIVSYTALSAGMDPPTFKTICQALLDEVRDFDLKM